MLELAVLGISLDVTFLAELPDKSLFARSEDALPAGCGLSRAPPRRSPFKWASQSPRGSC
jgi:hypothetical protein